MQHITRDCPEWVHVSACDDSLCVNLPRSCSFALLSWCPLISWCCRGFQNSAGGGGISFHCHDNDSDTLAPSLTQTSYCMETGMQFLLAAASDNPVWEWKVPKWLAIQAKLKGQWPIKGGTLEQHHPWDPRLALKTHTLGTTRTHRARPLPILIELYSPVSLTSRTWAGHRNTNTPLSEMTRCPISAIGVKLFCPDRRLVRLSFAL